VYSDSDDTYDMLIDNLYNYSQNGTCCCIVCVERRDARKGRKEQKRKGEKQGKTIMSNGFSGS